MCGIAGILLASRVSDPHRLASVRAMTETLRHRGPDGDGIWIDRDAGIALGHRRLAIVDLSEAGRQPMRSESGGLVVTYNGEIYNFPALRRELEDLGHRFRGGSDTEVMLAAIARWGLEAALCRFAGMFAFGLWDRDERRLHLVRDRMGKKPLYMAMIDGALVFASELKALLAVPGFRPEIDEQAVAIMIRQGWIPDRCCILRNVVKLPPGNLLSIRQRDVERTSDGGALRARIRPWWSLAAATESGRRNQLDGRDEEVVGELDQLLRQVVQERMVADVPLGAFLSGGIDSSTVVALMQAQSARPVRTFTIGFCESGYDESVDAGRVARRLGTDHTALHVTSDDARNVIPELPIVWDEPFSDASQIPTLLVSRLARRHVTVALSGDGGDECFAGYARHFIPARLAPLLASGPIVRRTAAAALRLLDRAAHMQILRAMPVPSRLRRVLQEDGLARLSGLIDAAGHGDIYDHLAFPSGPSMVLTSDPGEIEAVPPLDLVSRLIYRDMIGYLPGDILVKADRASMANSLEVRCPLLDHRVVEFAWRLPTGMKVRHGQGKWILREVLARYLPRALFERPKQGFDVPVAAWLRGPLRSWGEDLLAETRLKHQGLLDVGQVRMCWREHQSGRCDRSRTLWALLMLQSWLDTHAQAKTTASARADALQCELSEG